MVKLIALHFSHLNSIYRAKGIRVCFHSGYDNQHEHDRRLIGAKRECNALLPAKNGIKVIPFHYHSTSYGRSVCVVFFLWQNQVM